MRRWKVKASFRPPLVSRYFFLHRQNPSECLTFHPDVWLSHRQCDRIGPSTGRVGICCWEMMGRVLEGSLFRDNCFWTRSGSLRATWIPAKIKPWRAEHKHVLKGAERQGMRSDILIAALSSGGWACVRKFCSVKERWQAGWIPGSHGQVLGTKRHLAEWKNDKFWNPPALCFNPGFSFNLCNRATILKMCFFLPFWGHDSNLSQASTGPMRDEDLESGIPRKTKAFRI